MICLVLVQFVVFHCRERGIKLHAANSAGTLLGYGTDLDFIRPGIAMYGLPPGVYFILILPKQILL